MSRGLTATVKTETEKSAVTPVFLFEIHFSTYLYFWTGVGQISWNSQTWQGSGDVIKFSGIDETQQTEAQGIQLQLAGADQSLISAALTEDIQGRALLVYLGFLSSGSLLADPIGPFRYRMDTLIIDDDPDNSTISLTAESYLASLERPRVRRYTHEDQQIEFPGDLGLEFVASIQNKEIQWGKV